MTDAELRARLARLSPEELAELDRLLLDVPTAPDYHDWLTRVSPEMRWDWPWSRLVQEHVDALVRGDIEALMVEAPVRHGKSELLTIRLPVFAIDRDRRTRFILGCYNQELANKFSRKSRSLARRIGIPLSEERKAMSEWETPQGGGFRAIGVGAGVTGLGGNLIGIDDPIKNREDAESELVRDKTWDWYTDDLMTRLEPKARRFFVASPWHEDGLGQRILNSEEGKRWTHLRLPALAEDADPLGRAPGEALCPDRFTAADLAQIRERMGEYSFSALYQCRPVPRSGNMFPADQVTIVDAVPKLQPIRYWDKAGSDNAGAYTAGVKMGYADGKYWVLHVERFRLEAYERDKRMRLTAELDGVGCHQWTEQEPGSGGKESAQSFVRVMAGFAAHYEPVTGDKVTRADPWAAQWQAGNVRLLRGEWNPAYIREHGSFPNGTYKDQVDASAGCFQKLTKRPVAVPAVSLTKESHWRG